MRNDPPPCPQTYICTFVEGGGIHAGRYLKKTHAVVSPPLITSHPYNAGRSTLGFPRSGYVSQILLMLATSCRGGGRGRVALPEIVGRFSVEFFSFVSYVCMCTNILEHDHEICMYKYSQDSISSSRV